MDHACDVPVAVQQELGNLRLHLRRTEALRGFGVLLLLGTGMLVVSLTADFLADLDSSTRLWLLAGQVLLCLAAGVLGVVRPFLREIPDEDVAALAERRFPELSERLTSLVELSDERLPESERGSALMREMLQQETVREVSRNDLVDAVEAGRAVRPTVLGMVAVATCLLWLLLLPHPSRLLLARLLNPVGNYESAGPLTFEVTPADCVVGRGSDVPVSALIGWRDGREDAVTESVTLQLETFDGQTDRRELRFDADAGVFVAVIPDAQESFRFRVAAGGGRSKSVEVRVEDVPQIVTASLEVTPPPYVGRPRRSFDGVAGEMDAFEHSELVFELTFNKPVSSADLEWLGPLVIPDEELVEAVADDESDGSDDVTELAERRIGTYRNDLVAADEMPRMGFQIGGDGRSAVLRTSATVQGTLAFRLSDWHGLLNAEEPFRHLKIERDQPPQLDVLGGQQDTARPSDVYPFELTVSDDVGVEELELRITTREGLEVVQPVPAEQLGGRLMNHRFRIDLAGLDVEAGTVLRMQARAADGRPVPRPNEVWSEVRYVAVSEEAEAPGSRDLLAQQEQLRTELQSIREGLQQVTEISDELREQAAEAADSDEPLVAAEKIDELQQREAELTERLQQLAEQLRERPLFDKVAAVAERTASDELSPQLEQLRNARESSAQEQAETLKANGDATDMAAEQLLDLETRFDGLAELEQDLLELNRIAERAGRLAENAEELADLREELDDARQLAEAGPAAGTSAPEDADENAAGDADRLAAAQNELATAQQQLQAEHNEIANELTELLDDRPEVLDAARDQQLERLQQLAEQAGELADREELLAQALNEDSSDANAEPGGDSTLATEAQGEAGSESADGLPTLDELIEQQRELAAEAAEIGLAAAESQGEGSPAATSAIESALSAMQSQQQAEGGQFGEAARQAQQAAEAAQQAQEALADDQPALASRAEDVADGQQELARELDALQNSEQRRTAAQQAQQEQLADAAEQLAEQLGQSSESLAAEPLGLSEPGQDAATAQQAAESASQSAAQAAESLQDGSAAEAAQAAQQSAEALQEAAANAAGQQSASDSGEVSAAAEPGSSPTSSGTQPMPGDTPASSSSSSESPADDVPGELATQVVSAAQQLMQAQQQLGEAIAAVEPATSGQPSDTGSPAEGQGGSSEGAQGSDSPSNGESGESGQPSDASNEGSAGEAGQPGSSQSTESQAGQGADNSASSAGQTGDASSSQGAGQNSSTGGPAGQAASPASDALRRAAQSLAQASGLLSGASQQFSPQGGQQQGQGESGRGMSNGENSQIASELGSDGAGAAGFEEADSPLELQLRQQVMRDWGRLPVKLRTEILQSSDRKTNGEYAEIIKLYFEQIAAEEAGQQAGNSEQRAGNSR